MSNIKIVTDSTSDMPSDLLRQLDITVVPLKVHFGEETFYDGVDIEADAFYEKLAEARKMPTTSQPSPTDFVEVYQKVARDNPGCTVISIHISAVLSGTYQSAVLASSMLEEELDVVVLDAKKASYATGIIVRAAAEMAQNGKSKQEIMAAVNDMIGHTHVYFLLDTLEYLQKGGRIGKASALVGSLLNIKPILSLNKDGEVYPVEKVRGNKKAQVKMLDMLKEKVGNDPVHVAVIHSTSEPLARSIMDEVRSRFEVQSELLTSIGPVVGTHTGPNSVGVVMIKDEHYRQ